MNGTAETKTGLEDITITQATTGAGPSPTAVDGKFNITWKSDGKTISATITKNKEVEIKH